MTDTTTRKPQRFPLRPEPPRKLTAGTNVADAETGRRHGKVLAVGDLSTVRPDPQARSILVRWEDGADTWHSRSELVARFTSTSPRPKGGRK